MARITIFDTTLRHGVQSPGAGMTAGERLRMAHELATLGVDVVEAGFPAAPSEDAQAVRTIAREIEGPIVAAVARTSPAEIERCAELLGAAARARIHVFLPTSDPMLRGLGLTRAHAVETIAQSVARARSLCDDVEFGAEDALRTDLDFLVEAIAAAVAEGASTLNIADTTGRALPDEVGGTVRALIERVPSLNDRMVSTRCHDDLGLAVASSLAAIGAGARQVQCTIGGIGERAGVAALEEVVAAIAVRREGTGHETRVRTERLHRASRLLAYLTGIEPAPNKAVIGRNALSAKTGVHLDGVDDDPEKHEVMTLDTIGAPASERALDGRPGHHGLEKRYEALGYTLTPEELGRLDQAFTELAGRKTAVLDEDLLSLLHHGVMEDVPVRYRVQGLEVRCGSEMSRASVVLGHPDGEPPRVAEATGDGPIAATFAALDSLLDFRVTLRDLTIRSATPGGDALGEVSIHASIDGHTFTGRGAHTDVVRASADAFVHAVNKAAAARVLEEEHLAATADAWGV